MESPQKHARAVAPRHAALLAGAIVASLLGLVALLALAPEREPARVEPLAGSGAAEGGAGAGAVATVRPDGEDASGPGLAPERARAEVADGVRLAGPGRLEGRVLVRGTGEGVAGARVELLALPPASVELFDRVLRLARLDPALDRRALPVAVTGTDAAGGFRFEKVREGSYFVDARCAEHVPEGARTARVLASGDGGPIELWVRAGGGVRGRMARRDGEPVGGATALLVPGPGLALIAVREGSFRALEARTGADGRFAFAGVAPGRGYELSAQGPGTSVSHAVDLAVVAGEDTEVALVAREGGSVRGRVLSVVRAGPDERAGAADPVPVAGAHVAAVPRGLRDLRFAEEVLAATHAVTDAEGRYRMERVPPGEVDLIAFAPGCVASVSGPVRVVEGALEEAEDVELESGPTVRGRVVDAAGAPIAGARLRWNTFDFRSMGREGFEVRFAPFLTQAIDGFAYPVTGSDGAFVAGPFPGEPPYRIDVFAPGYQEARERWTPGEGPEELEVVLRRGGSVEGVVMDLERAEPVPRFRVQTFDRVELAVEEPGRFNPFAGGTLFEDPSGRFALEAMRTGEVTLRFQADGYLPAVLEDVRIEEGARTRGLIVKLVAGGGVRGTVLDAAGEPVAGAQVLALGASEGGGRPPRGARRGPPFDLAAELPPALLDYAAGLGLLAETSVRTDSAGAFELVGVEPGPTHLVALHVEHAPGRSEPIPVVAGEVVEGVEVLLSSGGGLFGSVEDRHGRPLPGSTVVAAAPARFGRPSASSFGGGLYQALADARGEYRIEAMSPGSYFVVATRGNEALDPLSFLGSFDFDLVTVPEGEPVRFDIVDDAAGATRVYGRVTDAGAPVERGSLTALGFESDNLLGVDFKVARLRSGGEYEFAGLAPGEYQLELQGGAARARMTVDVPDLPEHRIDLELPTGAIEGAVIDGGTGQPVPGCELVLQRTSTSEPRGLVASLVRAEGRWSRERTDADGEFRFARLEEGEYELAARPRRSADGTSLAPPDPIAIELRRGERRRGLSIELVPALTLEGRIVGEDGEAIEGARVAAFANGLPEPRPPRARTDAAGRFALGGLARGEHALRVSAEGYAGTTRAGIEVGEGLREELEIVLGRGVAVSLRVFGSDGRPVAGANGRLSRIEGELLGAAEVEGGLQRLLLGEDGTDADGRIELGRYEPGEYELEVWRGFARAAVPEVVLEPGAGAVEIDVTMP